jgi:hypothetical protein
MGFLQSSEIKTDSSRGVVFGSRLKGVLIAASKDEELVIDMELLLNEVWQGRF